MLTWSSSRRLWRRPPTRRIERGIGARGLRAVLEATMTELMYEVPSDPTISKVIITADSVLQKVKRPL